MLTFFIPQASAGQDRRRSPTRSREGERRDWAGGFRAFRQDQRERDHSHRRHHDWSRERLRDQERRGRERQRRYPSGERTEGRQAKPIMSSSQSEDQNRQFQFACLAGDLTRAKQLLDAGATVSNKESWGVFGHHAEHVI